MVDWDVGREGGAQVLRECDVEERQELATGAGRRRLDFAVVRVAPERRARQVDHLEADNLAHLAAVQDLEVGGFAKREALFDGYRAGGGTIDTDRFRWWKVLRTAWWGLGLADQAASHLDGSFSSIVMAASGRRVAELEYDVLMLLSREYAPLGTKVHS